MATLRDLLTAAGFTWDTGVIVWQSVTGEAYSSGWAMDDEVNKAEFIPNDHVILDTDFDTGHGAPRMPRFVAKDHKFIFFPVQYDGATWIEYVCQSLTPYVEGEEPMPYPGG